jgi:hypothetical protein
MVKRMLCRVVCRIGYRIQYRIGYRITYRIGYRIQYRIGYRTAGVVGAPDALVRPSFRCGGRVDIFSIRAVGAPLACSGVGWVPIPSSG